MTELAVLTLETGAIAGLLSVAVVVVLIAIYGDPVDPRDDVRARAQERLARHEAIPWDWPEKEECHG